MLIFLMIKSYKFYILFMLVGANRSGHLLIVLKSNTITLKKLLSKYIISHLLQKYCSSQLYNFCYIKERVIVIFFKPIAIILENWG